MSERLVDGMQADLDRFARLVAEQLGFQAHVTGQGTLGAALRERMQASGCHVAEAYLDRLASAAAGDGEWHALAELLTIGETYFFRTPDHFRAFSEIALPERMREQAGTRRLRLLSAGCASGEEPYTLAILAREALEHHPDWQVEITGLDLNASFLKKARQAHYSEWSLRSTASEARARNFRTEGRVVKLDDRVRAMVRFEERNLLQDDAAFWAPGAFDVIFCRNVGIYLTPEAFRQVVARFATALAPGGYLFLGPAETLRGYSRDFNLCHTHDTFYYTARPDRVPAPAPKGPRKGPGGPEPFQVPLPKGPRKGPEGSEPLRVPLPGAQAPSARGLLAAPTPPDPAWVEAIARASTRIAELAAEPDGVAVRPSPPAWDPAMAMELFGQERFAEALAHLRALPPEAASAPDVLLLLAAVLTNAGDCAEGERVCQQMLAIDELSAGAHYLLALCKEQSNDRAGAINHSQTAAYLDATFAMARLHLGLMAKQANDRPTARHELAAALELLPQEDASRVLLFGGGFGREALQALCRAELAACGGPLA